MNAGCLLVGAYIKADQTRSQGLRQLKSSYKKYFFNNYYTAPKPNSLQNECHGIELWNSISIHRNIDLRTQARYRGDDAPFVLRRHVFLDKLTRPGKPAIFFAFFLFDGAYRGHVSLASEGTPSKCLRQAMLSYPTILLPLNSSGQRAPSF